MTHRLFGNPIKPVVASGRQKMSFGEQLIHEMRIRSVAEQGPKITRLTRDGQVPEETKPDSSDKPKQTVFNPHSEPPSPSSQALSHIAAGTASQHAVKETAKPSQGAVKAGKRAGRTPKQIRHFGPKKKLTPGKYHPPRKNAKNRGSTDG